jgi:hypothetical protein
VAEHEYWMKAYARDADGLSTRLEQDLRFRLDDRGFLAGLEFMTYGSVLRPGNPFVGGGDSMVASGNDAQDPKAAPAVEVMNRVFFSLAPMNCRNVTLRERGTGKAKGAGPGGDAFHEVVIDGNTRGPSVARGEAAGDGAGRRHLSRGHFKTFTEDAPLLGKPVGTYWWGWQVRGQEGQGLHREDLHPEAGTALTSGEPLHLSQTPYGFVT